MSSHYTIQNYITQQSHRVCEFGYSTTSLAFSPTPLHETPYSLIHAVTFLNHFCPNHLYLQAFAFQLDSLREAFAQLLMWASSPVWAHCLILFVSVCLWALVSSLIEQNPTTAGVLPGCSSLITDFAVQQYWFNGEWKRNPKSLEKWLKHDCAFL